MARGRLDRRRLAACLRRTQLFALVLFPLVLFPLERCRLGFLALERCRLGFLALVLVALEQR